MEDSVDEDPQKTLADCPVRMKPLTSFFKVKNTSPTKSHFGNSIETNMKMKEMDLNSCETEVRYVEEKQSDGVMEIPYEDFLKSSGKKCDNSIKLSDMECGANEKYQIKISEHDMSQKAIKMPIKSPLSNKSAINVDKREHHTVTAEQKIEKNLQSNGINKHQMLHDQLPESGSMALQNQNSKSAHKSILNFFKKEIKPIADAKEEPFVKRVTVKVEVHPEPPKEAQQKSASIKTFDIFNKAKQRHKDHSCKDDSGASSRCTSPKSNVSVTNNDFDDSIILLEEVVEKTVLKPKSNRQIFDSCEKGKVDEEQRKVIAARMNSLDQVKVAVGKKNIQATLQITKSSMKLTKAPKSESLDNEIESNKEEVSSRSTSKSSYETPEKPAENSPLDTSAVDFTPKSAKNAAPKSQISLVVEIGHDAVLRKNPTEEGHTHDWKVFLRLQDPEGLEGILEKVIFKLHETFINPQREMTCAPYEVRETGYGGFDLPITLMFKPKYKPRTTTLLYNLFLNATYATHHLKKETINLRYTKVDSMTNNVKEIRSSRKIKAGKITKAKKLLDRAKGVKTSPPHKPLRLKTLNPNKSVTKTKLIPYHESQTNFSSHTYVKSQIASKEFKGKENDPLTPQKKYSSTPIKERNSSIEVNESSESTPQTLRRSSRRSALLATRVMSQGNESDGSTSALEQSPSGRSEKKRVGKRQLRQSPNSSPTKKKARKLAPIFCGKNKEEKEESDVEIVMTEEDKERQRIRQAFLMSGVPEALRKQAQVQAADAGPSALSWPTTAQCHVQQRDETSVWTMGELPLREQNVTSSVISTPSLQMPLISQEPRPTKLKLELKRGSLSEEEKKMVLAEIASTNRSYPAKRVFKQLQARLGAMKQSCSDTKEETQIPTTKKRKLNDMTEQDGGDRKRKKGATGSRLSLRRGKSEKEAKDNTEHEECVQQVTSAADSDLPPLSSQERGSSLLWTDKYAPACMSEVLGKSNSIRKLHTWLENWKQVTNKEMRRLKKEIEKQERKAKNIKLLENKGLSDQSDFESDVGASDSDFDPEEDVCDGLCNTMLIQGPHGVGKTSLVYALASQLGYKVFEVHAGDVRAGRQVLQQLQEATQSHQVTHSNLTDVFSTILSGQPLKKDEKKIEPEKPKKKAASDAFNNMFGKAKRDKKTQNSSPSKENSSRKGQKSSDDVIIVKEEKGGKVSGKSKSFTPKIAQSSIAQSKALDLTSCSLILFEEVDVVFEEDRGFWAAIQTFCNTTKRPIILTTSQHAFLHAFDPRADLQLEMLTLSLPRPENVVSYLQLVCAAEGVRTDAHDVMALLQLCAGDVRRALHALQVWVQSGASPSPLNQPLAFHQPHAKSDRSLESDDEGIDTGATTSQVSNGATAQDSAEDSQLSEDDFVPMRRPGRRVPRAIVEDESSRDSVASTRNTVPVPAVNMATSLSTPPLHHGALAHQLGFTVDSLPAMTLDLPTLASQLLSSCTSVVTLVSKSESQHVSLLWNNLKWMLPLPRQQVPLESYTCFLNKDHLKKPTSTRIKNINNLFDSGDESDIEIQSVVKTKPAGDVNVCDVSQNISTTGSAQQNTAQTVEKDLDVITTSLGTKENENALNINQDTNNKEGDIITNDEHVDNVERNRKKCKQENKISDESRLMLDYLSSVSDVSEMFSFCDAYLGVRDEDTLSPGHESTSALSWQQAAGHADMCSTHGADDAWQHAHAHNINAHVQVTQLSKQCRRLQALNETHQHMKSLEGLAEKLTLPVESISPAVRIRELSSAQQRKQDTCLRALRGVSDCVNPRSRRDSPVQATCAVSSRALAMEYMPTLRTIAKTEELRKSAKTKRRFLHYFDANRLGLKSSVVEALNSSFM